MNIIPFFAKEYVNLASAGFGALAVECSDDFFGKKERILKDEPPVFVPDKYDKNGKWMDGWESRRRRNGGYDWLIIELGTKALIKGFDIDTSHFTGNFPPGASIEGASCDAVPHSKNDWFPLTPQVTLEGNKHHFFESSNFETPAKWIRLNIYPDGGVARLRVYGDPTPSFINLQEAVELSAVVNGGRIVDFSNSHYGNPEVILSLTQGNNMGDGWETARRRTPGNEWIIVKLGKSGVVQEIHVDTTHFKGNFPDGFSVQGSYMTKFAKNVIVTQSMFWPTICPFTKLKPDELQIFKINCQDTVSHIKFNSFPDGGISRLRIFGK